MDDNSYSDAFALLLPLDFHFVTVPSKQQLFVPSKQNHCEWLQ
jgi:hypothetical protein